MKNLVKCILFALTALLLFASMMQKALRWHEFKPLKGVVVEQPMPQLSLASCGDGSFQQQTEQYLKQHFGYREPLIRLYNQYLWDCYATSPILGSQIIVGKDNWLYEPLAISNYYQWQFHNYASDSAEMAHMLADEAQRLLQLQQRLDEYGIHLFVCLVPAKDLLCPEYLPENPNTTYDNEPKFSARYFNEQAYSQLGINHLNLEQYFLAMKDTADFQLFPKTGTHWTKYASLYAADTLIRYMEHLGNMNVKNIVIGPRELDNARDPDDDLESLLNLMKPISKPQYWYAETTSDGDTTATKPKVIVVGDSFWWNIAIQIPQGEIFSSYPYLYYNSTVYYHPPYNSVAELDLQEELLTSDFIILFYNAATQYRLNDGFTQDALAVLENIDNDKPLDSVAYIERVVQRTIADILADPNWSQMVREKAVANGVEFEQALRNDAQWVVNNELQNGTFKWPATKNR